MSSFQLPAAGGPLTLEELERLMMQQPSNEAGPSQSAQTLPPLPGVSLPQATRGGGAFAPPQQGSVPSSSMWGWSAPAPGNPHMWNPGSSLPNAAGRPPSYPLQFSHQQQQQQPQMSFGAFPQQSPTQPPSFSQNLPTMQGSFPRVPLSQGQVMAQGPHGQMLHHFPSGQSLPHFPTQAQSLHHVPPQSPVMHQIPQMQQLPTMAQGAMGRSSIPQGQPRKGQSEGSVLVDANARSPLKKPIEAADVKSELRTRFDWQPMGTMEVRPNVTGPDEYIDVMWEIPARFVSREGLMTATSGSSSARKGMGANREEPDQGDWIGLFRSRQRIDESTGHILTRETSGRATYDAKTDTVRGRVRLRAPRGVGTYDFRYFTSGGQKPPSSEQVDITRFPVARSPPLVVEVQGAALYEALDFADKNVRDKRRLASAAQQLGTLLRQVKTLRYPLQHPSMRPEDQERRLLEEVWKVVATCIERGVALDDSLAHTVKELEQAVEVARIEYERARGNEIHDQDLDDNLSDVDGEELNALTIQGSSADEQTAKDVRKTKRRVFVHARRDLAQKERDRASVGSSVHSVLDEIRGNVHLFALLSDQRKRYLVSFARRYSAVEEHFFPTEAQLRDYVRQTLGIARWGLNEDGRIEVEAGRSQEIDQEILETVKDLLPHPTFFEQRRLIIRKLQLLLDASFSKTYGACRLAPFGSSANSFGSPNSDLDLCLVLLDRNLDSQQEATRAVELVAELLSSNGYKAVDDSRKNARIPIVQFTDPEFNVECDICVNNPLAIRNTLLLRTYGSIDDRVRILVYLVKLWAKRRDLNDPSTHTMSSYGWILLIINYLQRVGLLPNLQEMPVRLSDQDRAFFPHVPCASSDGKIHDTYFFGDPESTYFLTPEARERAAAEARRKSSAFRANLGQLAAGFFWDLAMTDWRKYVASVRSGELVLKSMKASEDSWKLHPRCAIEDPFETSYDVGHVLRDSTFRRCRLEAARAYALLVGCQGEFLDASVKVCLEELVKGVKEKS